MSSKPHYNHVNAHLIKKMNQIILVVIVFTIQSCSPKIITNSLDDHYSSRIEFEYEPFAIFEADTIDRSNVTLLGQIEIKDSGLSLNCDYETIKRLAKTESLKLGGNSFVITEHKEPSSWSTCHRIKADVFQIENPRDYETEVIWNKNRKLEIEDFKGPTAKRPFTAGTSSSFRYRIEGRPAFPKKYKLFVETYFDCYLSYFKHTDFDSHVLDHEQIHFDISELYGRIFLDKVKNEAKDLNEFLAKQESILNEIGREMQLKQDEYDSEVYADRSLQSKWSEWIKEELKNYEVFSNKILIVKKENGQ